MWVCWQLFLGPGTERLTYGIVAPFLGWAVATSVGREPLRYAWAVTACVVVALFSLGDIEKEVLRLVPFAKALLPTGVAIFAAWLVWFERGPVTTGIHEPTNLSPTRSSQISDQLVNAGSLP